MNYEKIIESGNIVQIFSLVMLLLSIGCISTNNSNQTHPSTPVYQNVDTSVLNGVISVGAGKLNSYEIQVPSQVSPNVATISGSFTASGGSGNDIIVVILDQNSYINFINGHSTSSYYNPGQVTTGNFTVTVPAGNYYLIYSNTFSIFTSKNVQTNVDVKYTVCVQNCN